MDEPALAPDATDDLDESPLLERYGLRFLQRRAEKLPPVIADDEVHYLNPTELRALRRISRGMVTRAAVVGALSALLTGLAEVSALPLFGIDPDDSTLAGLARFWGLVGGVTAVATALEIGWLYFDALRSVHELARAAGLAAFRGTEAEQDRATASALARAALELPNPPKGLYEIDPHREVGKLRLLAAALLYKLKIGLTNFLLKAILRRMLGRAVLKVWLVFVAVPVTAAWNGIVAWWVIREARIRVMGPSAAREMVQIAFAAAPSLSERARHAALRAVAGSIVRTHDLHPNLVALFEEVRHKTGMPDDAELDDTHALLTDLGALEPDEQSLILSILAIAAILDGRLARDERRLLVEARAVCDRDDDLGAVRQLRRAFVRGLPVDPAIVRATGR